MLWQNNSDDEAKTVQTNQPEGRAKASALSSFVHRACGFKSDESGSLIIFSLFMFVMMLMITGFGIDLMRYESTRTKLQATVDRAVLAAADLDQELDPQAVVEDYFDKAGLEDYLVGVDVKESGFGSGEDMKVNYREVSAITFANVHTFFMMFNPNTEVPEDHPVRRRMGYWMDRMGSRPLPARAEGTAIERFTDIEISLVVDVSGSMNSYSRIDNLKDAAQEFVEAVVLKSEGDPSLTTVSIVPYSAVVNIGETLAPHFSLNQTHNYSLCPRLPTDTFGTSYVSRTTSLDMIAHFEYGSGSSTPINVPWCPNTEFRGNEIVPLSADVDELQDALEELDAYGNTAIDMGMKWGLALIDPDFRPVVDDLITDSVVVNDATGRPTDYGNNDGMKVVVLMTDGANTTEYDLKEPYKSGMSNIWVRRDYEGQPLQNISSNRWSIRYSTGGSSNDHTDDRFMRRGVNSSQRQLSYPYGYSGYNDAANTPDSDGLVTRLSWQEIFAVWEDQRVNYVMYKEAYDLNYISYNAYRAPDYARQSIVNSSQADARLSTICGVARDNDVLVFTIAFEAPQGGKDALLDCASSPSHYFEAEGTDITDAFMSIASEITQLRLTQ